MKTQKIVWFEGMKLDPHHFQQQDRYNDYYINTRLNLINPNNWGIKEISIDNAALARGSFNLISCTGVMPDGIVFNIPYNDSAPSSKNIEGIFTATTEKLEIYLAIPTDRVSGKNILLSDPSVSDSVRYSTQNVDIPDLNTGTNIRSVGIVKANYKLVFGIEELEDFSYIKLGEITRSSDGKYIIDRKYVPTCLEISSSDVLMEHLRNILSTLVSKSRELKTQVDVKNPELAITQVEILMMLQTVNSFIPLLNYFNSAQHIHPENLFLLFLNLLGQLSTFSYSGLRPDQLPIYDHKNLTETFEQVVKEIELLLDIKKTIERRDVLIPLRKQADNLLIGQLSSNQMSAQLYLAVTSDISEKKIITEFPKNIKISAYEEIFAVHQAGIQGVSIEYIPRPPSNIPINEKAIYFKINKEGRFWEKIITKNNIAFFIASEFKSVQMELVLIL